MRTLQSLSLLIFSALLWCNNAAHAQTYTWVGAVDGDYQNPSNWNPAIAPFEHTTASSLVIGAGKPNACVHSGKNLSGGYRPGKLNTLTGGSFTINGSLIAWASDSLNGTINISSTGDFNDRGVGYIGRNSTAVMTISGNGTFTTKGGCRLALGTEGASATVNLLGGFFNVGYDLFVATGKGLSATINIKDGLLAITNNLVMGTNARINITGAGYMKLTGDKTKEINGFLASGLIGTAANKKISVAFDGTNTWVNAL